MSFVTRGKGTLAAAVSLWHWSGEQAKESGNRGDAPTDTAFLLYSPRSAKEPGIGGHYDRLS